MMNSNKNFSNPFARKPSLQKLAFVEQKTLRRNQIATLRGSVRDDFKKRHYLTKVVNVAKPLWIFSELTFKKICVNFVFFILILCSGCGVAFYYIFSK